MEVLKDLRFTIVNSDKISSGDLLTFKISGGCNIGLEFFEALLTRVCYVRAATCASWLKMT